MKTAKPAQPAIPPVVGLVIGVLAVSTASTFIRMAQMHMAPLATSAWRLTVASLILAPFALATRRAEWRSLSRREWAWLITSGIVLAIHFYTWIASLAFTSVAASVVLVSTNPLFVSLISHFFLKERLTRAMTLGMLVALIGSAIIGLGDFEAGSHQITGDLLALTGALAVAVYMLIGRSLRGKLSLLGYVFPVYATAAIVLMGAALLSQTKLWGFPSDAWLWILLMALLPQIIGHSSFNWALAHLSATYVSLSVLAEPVASVLLAWLILNEAPTWSAFIGGLLILGGIVIASYTPKKSILTRRTA